MGREVLDSNEARTRWRDVLDRVSAGTADVVIERYGRPVAAVIRYEDYLAMETELEELRLVREAEGALEAWERDPSLGRPFDEVDAELEAAAREDE